MKFAQVAALIAVALPLAPASSASPTSPTSPTSPAQVRPAPALSRAEQLDVMADFFVPERFILALSREQCGTAFHTHLMGDPKLQAMEKALPGITDRMVAASLAYCDVEMKKVLDARQDQIRTYVSAQFSPVDLARLARMLAPSVQEARDMKVDARAGDTMKEIVGRSTGTPEQDQRLRAAQMSFARTPGGIPLINKVSAYQAVVKPDLLKDQASLVDIATRSFPVAHREANLYAHEKGMLALYLDAAAGKPATTVTPASAPSGDAAPAPVVASADPRPASLSGSGLYIYSFLDVRQEEYTPKVLGQFEADLTARLLAFDISSKILRFSETEKGKDEFFAVNRRVGSESRSIPVADTIAANFVDERMSKARFRLVVFPSDFTTSGVWRFYDIRFILMDVLTGDRLWEYVYSGKHMVMAKESENAQARSKKILDHAFAELKAKGLL